MKQIRILLAGVALSLLIIACGGDNSSSNTSQTGTLALKLIDAPGDFEAVYVTIKEVQVHLSSSDIEDNDEINATDSNESNATDNNVAEDQNDTDTSGWKTVVSPNKTYDLLELQNGVEAVLGEENLTVGHYTQMRLILDDDPDDSNNTQNEAHPYGNYVIIDGNSLDIIVPSAMQTGIKLITGFDIEANKTTTLTLDFDAKKSLHRTGNGQWKMKPTIKIIQE